MAWIHIVTQIGKKKFEEFEKIFSNENVTVIFSKVIFHEKMSQRNLNEIIEF